MRLVRGGMRAFELSLADPLDTAHGRIDARRGELLTLMDETGCLGFGEATPLPAFGTEDLERARVALGHALDTLVGSEFSSLEAALASCAGICGRAPCALSALDSALHDLAAQRAGRSLAGWLRESAGRSGPPAGCVAVQALVGGADPAAVAAAAQRHLEAGFETFKLKLAVSPARRDPGLDLERVAALRSAIGPRRRIRLDANEAWTLIEAEKALQALADFDVEYVEQPVDRARRDALKRLDRNGAIAVAADEALLGAGLEACLEMRAASIFVVKPAALGGLARSLPVLRRAETQGIRVVLSNLIEGAVGRAATTALAAALGGDREVHGLGTQGLLASDLVADREVHRGAIATRDSPGLACHPGPVWESAEAAEGPIWGALRVVEAAR